MNVIERSPEDELLERCIEITENYRYEICCGERVEDTIRELLEELRERRKAMQWVPVSEGLPESFEKHRDYERKVLIFTKSKKKYLAIYHEKIGEWQADGHWIPKIDVTHWAYIPSLPEPPRKDGAE